MLSYKSVRLSVCKYVKRFSHKDEQTINTYGLNMLQNHRHKIVIVYLKPVKEKSQRHSLPSATLS